MTDPSGLSATAGLEAWAPDPALDAQPDPGAQPDGFMIALGDVRLHFLDWGEPQGGVNGETQGGGVGQPARRSGVLLLPGLMQPAWSWAPVARRLYPLLRTVIADLRGQGLSDAPPAGYDPDTLAGDAIAVAEATGLLDAEGSRLVLAGHGLGALVAASAAARLGARCAGLVLVDGGWERLETVTGVDADEFLRGLDEPPEVLRSLDAWLADRRGFDPSTWDADQERAAREGVVETAAGRVVRTVRPFVVEALVRTMFQYQPAEVLSAVDAPVIALVALGSADPETRLAELRHVGRARSAAGRGPVRVTTFDGAGHNLMRYRPALLAATILSIGGAGPSDRG